MIFVAEHSVRISLLVAAVLAAVALLRSSSAALRHWLLAVALTAAAAMPLLTIVVPSWRLTVPRAASPSPGSNAPAVSLTIMPQEANAGAVDAAAIDRGGVRGRTLDVAALIVAVSADRSLPSASCG